MNAAFGYGIGVPSPIKVIYDEQSKSFKVREDENIRPPRFSLTSADLKLKLYFSAHSGEFCGMEYRCGALADIEGANISLPPSTDGYFKIPQNAGFDKAITYVVAPATRCFLSENFNVALITLGEGVPLSCFKIAQNLLLGVDECGNPHSFYILL